MPNEASSSDLPSYVRDRRVFLGLTKVDAAEIAGISRRTWNEVEAGTRAHPNATTLAAMDRALGLREGSLYAISARSSHDRIEQLRRAAAYLFRTMTTTDFNELMETHPELHETIRALVDEAEALRRGLDRGTEGRPGRQERGDGQDAGASTG